MKFRFEREELLYVFGIFKMLASASDIDRKQRRNITRLANKFAPNAKHTFLKPSEREYVISLMSVGANILDQEIAKPAGEGAPPDRTEILKKQREAIDTIVARLVGAA